MPAPIAEKNSKSMSLFAEKGSIHADLVRSIFAMSEMCYDPLRQGTMDSMYHAWLQPKYDEARRWYEKKECSKEER